MSFCSSSSTPRRWRSECGASTRGSCENGSAWTRCTYDERRAKLREFNVAVTLWKRDHEPRFAIDWAFDLSAWDVIDEEDAAVGHLHERELDCRPLLLSIHRHDPDRQHLGDRQRRRAVGRGHDRSGLRARLRPGPRSGRVRPGPHRLPLHRSGCLARRRPRRRAHGAPAHAGGAPAGVPGADGRRPRRGDARSFQPAVASRSTSSPAAATASWPATATGSAKDDRYRRTDEFLDVVRAIWTSADAVRLRGRVLPGEERLLRREAVAAPLDPDLLRRRLRGGRAGRGEARRRLHVLGRAAGGHHGAHGCRARRRASRALPGLQRLRATHPRRDRSRGLGQGARLSGADRRPSRRTRPVPPPRPARNACSISPRNATSSTTGSGWRSPPPPAPAATPPPWSAPPSRSPNPCCATTTPASPASSSAASNRCRTPPSSAGS